MKRPMANKIFRVFLDSNVILSGLISDKGAPRIILDILSLKLPFFVGMTGEYNLMEIERNVAKKIPKALSLYKEYLSKLNLKIVPLPSKEEVTKFCSHSVAKDMPVLVSAINGQADFLITGDKKHFGNLPNKATYPFEIMSPSDFLKTIIQRIME